MSPRKDYTLFESLTQVGQILSIISIMAEGINLARNTYLVHSSKYNISLVSCLSMKEKGIQNVFRKGHKSLKMCSVHVFSQRMIFCR